MWISFANGIQEIKLLFLPGIQERLVAVTEELSMHDGHIDSITYMKSAKTTPDKMEDPKRCIITDIDLRGDIQRNDQKNSDVKFNRLKKLIKLEGADFECLQALDRNGSKLAVQFRTSLAAQKFEQEFKKIKFAGTNNGLIWSKVSKNNRPRSSRT